MDKGLLKIRYFQIIEIIFFFFVMLNFIFTVIAFGLGYSLFIGFLIVYIFQVGVFLLISYGTRDFLKKYIVTSFIKKVILYLIITFIAFLIVFFSVLADFSLFSIVLFFLSVFVTVFAALQLTFKELGINRKVFVLFRGESASERGKKFILNENFLSPENMEKLKKYKIGQRAFLDSLLREIWDKKDDSNIYGLLENISKELKEIT